MHCHRDLDPDLVNPLMCLVEKYQSSYVFKQINKKRISEKKSIWIFHMDFPSNLTPVFHGCIFKGTFVRAKILAKFFAKIACLTIYCNDFSWDYNGFSILTGN